MGLKPEAAIAGRDFGYGAADTGKARQQVERALQPGVLGLCLIGSKSFLGIAVNLDKVAFRPRRKAELSRGGRQHVDARPRARPPWLPC